MSLSKAEMVLEMANAAFIEAFSVLPLNDKDDRVASTCDFINKNSSFAVLKCFYDHFVRHDRTAMMAQIEIIELVKLIRERRGE